jgi:glycosyltransferase involved in cell wall biosynthesis
MHILIISSEPLIPKEAPLRGIFQYHQALALAKMGLTVGVISPERRSLKLLKRGLSNWKYGVEREYMDEIVVYRQHGWNFFPRFKHLGVRRWINDGVNLFKLYIANHGVPDIIHAHNALNAGYLASEIKRLWGLPYVLTEHSSHFSRGLVTARSFEYARLAYRNSSQNIVVSPQLGRVLEHSLSPDGFRWTSIPNLLDPTLETDATNVGLPPKISDRFVIFNAASIDKNKNHQLLIDAFELAVHKNPALSLRIAGEGPLSGQIRQYIRKRGLASHIVLLGRLNREEMRRELELCNVCVLSSTTETFGVVLIEALAFGRPVISTACGGPDSIVNSTNGLLVPIGDKKALSDAFINVATNYTKFDFEIVRSNCISLYGSIAISARLISCYRDVLKATQ